MLFFVGAITVCRKLLFAAFGILSVAFLHGLPVSVAQAKPASEPQWIWLQEESKSAEQVYFRTTFQSGGVSAARMYIAADDAFEVFLDGKSLASHAAWQESVFVDLAKHIDLENNRDHVLAISATNAQGPGGLLVKIEFESGWKDPWTIVSGPSWQASPRANKGWKTDASASADSWRTPDIIAAAGKGVWGNRMTTEKLVSAAALKEPTATPVSDMKVADGFQVELIYSVPRETQGSWVNMCVTPDGRLITSDQYGSLYEVTPVGIQGAKEVRVKKINVDIGEAQGLLWAFDSLYVSVNKGKKYAGGLYRVTDSDNDGQLDHVATLRPLQGSGEHGPHAVLPHPDGESLVIVCGNRTDLTDIDSSMVPSWDEDQLLPRVTGKFMKGVRAPGGVIYRIEPAGETWEVIASGFRNQYDAAFNKDGELFTYDADMEWDINTPWYRPTRINHVVSGGEFGWRSGGGKWPAYYPDSVGAVVNIGPGSPTGVCFGYGTDFPTKYQEALYACDWSYGKLYAVHLTPSGGTFRGDLEEFITGIPLPLTDVVVNPEDQAMYFTIGGRKVQSGLYKVTYSKSAKVEIANGEPPLSSETALLQQRRDVESLHGRDNIMASQVWNALGSDHQAIRYAARVALEKIPRDQWMDKALSEPDTQIQLTALLALARTFERTEKGSGEMIDSPLPDWNRLQRNPELAQVTDRILNAIYEMDLDNLTDEQSLQLLRAMSLTFLRIAPPSAEVAEGISAALTGAWPSDNANLNSEIASMMVYLQSKDAARLLIEKLESSPTQEEQITYAAKLRLLKAGWTPALQERYFRWFTRAGGYAGGNSFQLFVNNIKAEAVAGLSDADRSRLQPILDEKPADNTPVFSTEPRPFVRKWAMDDILPLLQTGLQNRSFENGRRMFGAAKCFACHRFDQQGGSVGPDLTSLSGRFSARDLLESIVEPSKEISDQYGSVQIITMDGKVITGRIINLSGDSFRIQTDMMKPSQLTSVDRRQVEEIVESKLSMMPNGLLDTLNEEEILDLMAYLLSRGDRSNAMFNQN